MLVVLLLLISVPLVELYAAIQVAQVIGGWETIALLVLMGVVGAWLLRQQGMSVLSRLGQAVAEQRPPEKELVDGFLLLVAGALLLTPGFVGDVLALLLMLPPTRALLRGPLVRRLRKGGAGGMLAGFASPTGSRFVGTFRAGRVVDVSGRPSDERGRPELDR